MFAHVPVTLHRVSNIFNEYCPNCSAAFYTIWILSITKEALYLSLQYFYLTPIVTGTYFIQIQNIIDQPTKTDEDVFEVL